MSCDLNPNPTSLPRLFTEVCDCLSRLPNVAHILSFGSLARNAADRWSDLDLIVITAEQNQQQHLFTHLARHKSILHHGPSGYAQPSGSYILGIVFTDESIFHCLDLNCLSLPEYNIPGTLNRFGQTVLLYSRQSPLIALPLDLTISPITEHADEKRINEALHFTKKTLKRALRKTSSIAELRQRADYLQQVMADYPPVITFPSGHIGQLAHCYLKLALQMTD